MGGCSAAAASSSRAVELGKEVHVGCMWDVLESFLSPHLKFLFVCLSQERAQARIDRIDALILRGTVGSTVEICYNFCCLVLCFLGRLPGLGEATGPVSHLPDVMTQ